MDGSHSPGFAEGWAGGKLGFYGVVPVVQPTGADQVAVTLGNTDSEIGGLTVSANQR